jgi:hypothetical protein
MSANRHSVFVLDHEEHPLMPTTPCRARKLIRAGVAKKVWSKFNTFGIQLLAPTRSEVHAGSLGVDHGTKWEGYSVVCGEENSLNVQLCLPDKKKIRAKLEQRSTLRRTRRSRKCRRRKARFNNRKRKEGFLAPSQQVIVQSRQKVIRAILAIYPIHKAGLENIKFCHIKHCWGVNFSTVEIGKARIRQVFADHRVTLHEFEGHQTCEIRERFGYKKCSDKSAERFEAHCCDSLTLACFVQEDRRVEPGRFVVVDDTYRYVRRKLHDAQFAKGGVRPDYSRGTVRGLRKGLKVGYKGQSLMLTGVNKDNYRLSGKNRPTVKSLAFISSKFHTR